MGTQFLCEPVFLGWYSEESRWFCGLFVNHGKLDPRSEAAGSAGGGEQRLHVLGHAHRPEGLPAKRAQHLRRGRHALRSSDPGTLFSAVVSFTSVMIVLDSTSIFNRTLKVATFAVKSHNNTE